MTIEAWLTAGLLFTAASQAAFQWWGSKIAEQAADAEADRRLKERNAADVLRRRAADDDRDWVFFEVWAESFRVESLADQWAEQDLVELSVLRLLSPDTVRPADSNAFLRSAIRIGHEASLLAGVAVTFANDVAQQVAMFNEAVADVESRATRQRDLPGADRLRMVRLEPNQELDKRVAQLRRGVRELALLLNDVAMQSSRAGMNRTLNFSDNLRSQIGRGAVDAVVTRLAEPPQSWTPTSPQGAPGPRDAPPGN